MGVTITSDPFQAGEGLNPSNGTGNDGGLTSHIPNLDLFFEAAVIDTFRVRHGVMRTENLLNQLRHMSKHSNSTLARVALVASRLLELSEGLKGNAAFLTLIVNVAKVTTILAGQAEDVMKVSVENVEALRRELSRMLEITRRLRATFQSGEYLTPKLSIYSRQSTHDINRAMLDIILKLRVSSQIAIFSQIENPHAELSRIEALVTDALRDYYQLLNKRFEELESEFKSLRRSQILSFILKRPSKMDSLAHLKGKKAQIMVDFLAEVLEHRDTLEPNAYGIRILHFLNNLVESTQVFPKRAKLSNVQFKLTDPVKDEGAYGLIYKGVFRERVVCVKAIRVQYHTSAGEGLAAQVRELVLLAHISHPNVIPLYGVYLSSEVTPRICIVSPWMENGNLAGYLKKHPSAPKFPLLCDVAAGLEFLHDTGIVHGGLKAQNVLVSVSQRVMLADFGIASVLHTSEGTMTARDFSGTVYWMAPELLVGPGLAAPTEQSDMWGFAYICYEVLTGEIPLVPHYKPQSRITAFMKSRATPRRLKPRRNPAIPGGGLLTKLVEQCWNRDPSRRPTASEAVRLLAELKIWDSRPSTDEGLSIFEAVKSSRTEVKINYTRLLSIVQGA